MNRLKTLITLGIALSFIILSCKKEALRDGSISSNQLNEAKIDQHSLQKQLVTGLGGGWGSTIGPGGDLFVPDGKAGAILRIDPKTGDYTTYASGLPKLIPE